MRRSLLLLALPLLIASNAYSQPTRQVCIPAVQAAKIADSLAVLPLVRREATAWQQASYAYQLAADSLWRANSRSLEAQEATQRAFYGQLALTANETAKASQWKQRARKRGLLNYLLLTGLAGAGYVILKP